MSLITDLIVKKYGEGMLRRSAMNIRGGAGVFEKLLEGKGYKRVLEIGTYRGVSAAEISQYVGDVVTIDLLQGRIEQLEEKHDRHAFWDSLGITNIVSILVKDDDEKANCVEGIDFDFAFVDGGHDAESVQRDFEIVKKCGRVLFHDADDNRLREGKSHSPNHVFEFISTLPKDQVTFHDIFAYWQGS